MTRRKPRGVNPAKPASKAWASRSFPATTLKVARDAGYAAGLAGADSDPPGEEQAAIAYMVCYRRGRERRQAETTERKETA